MGLKIGIITPEYPHILVKHSAGIGTSIKNLSAALTTENHEVTIFVYNQESAQEFFDGQVKIILIKKIRYKLFSWFFYRKYLEKFINTYLDQHILDILEAPDWTGVTSFCKFKVPLIIRFHGSDAYFCYLEKRKQKFKNFIFEKWAVSSANGLISPTKFAGDLSLKIFKSYHIPNQIIHYGLDLKNFNNEKPGVFNKGIIIYVGTIIRKKGVLDLPPIFEKVLQKNPNSKLILIGPDAPDIMSGAVSTVSLLMESFSSITRKRVEYLGKMGYEQTIKHIRQANICVYPTYAETLGMVTIESMAMKKAVVSSDFGWAQELIVDGESGFLINPSCHDKFAARINEILEDDQFALRIGEKARKRVEDIFDISLIVKQNVAFYTTFLK